MGMCSRRRAEEYIEKGLVTLNGEVVKELGTKINPEKDKVELLPDALRNLNKNKTIAFNKPRGILTNCPEPGEKEIKDLLPVDLKDCSSIGRLDKDSEGLILLTTDGTLAKRILQARNPHEREYIVRINKPLTPLMKQKLQNGVIIDGRKTRPAKVYQPSPQIFHITLREGRNRQIRKMCRVVGAVVTKLQRIRFGNIRLEGLKSGQYRRLEKKELRYFNN